MQPAPRRALAVRLPRLGWKGAGAGRLAGKAYMVTNTFLIHSCVTRLTCVDDVQSVFLQAVQQIAPGDIKVYLEPCSCAQVFFVFLTYGQLLPPAYTLIVTLADSLLYKDDAELAIC